MKRTLVRAGLAAAWMLLAAVIALYVIPPPWEPASGRDFRPSGAVLAVILLISAAVFRFRLHWSLASLGGGLALIEALSLVTIGYFSSGDLFHNLFSAFNLWWLAFINRFIGLPWVAGIAIGSGMLWLKHRRAGNN